MSLIKLELDNMMIAGAPRETIWPQIQKFMSDMNEERSGFFNLPVTSTWAKEIDELQPVLAKRIPEVRTFLHLGIGGSSLGAETIVRALASPKAPTFHFLDNIDPDYLWQVLEQTDPRTALVYVVTKSGTTMETLAQFAFILQWLEKNLGAEEARKRLVFCTDPVKGDLRQLAKQWSVPTFSVPSSLGGRFSALCGVGLFPAMVAGIDTAEMMKGAAALRTQIVEQINGNMVPMVADLAWRILEQQRANKRNITVLMPYSQRLKPFSSWFTQLWAESLGKNGKGNTPVPATGATDQHSILQLLRDGPQDKVVGFVQVSGFDHLVELKWAGPKLDSLELITGITLNQLIDAEFSATRQVLVNNQRPTFTVTVPKLNAHTLGQLFFFCETLTAIAGYFLEIDPFDQPGVEEGKKITQATIRACKKALNA